MNPKIAKKILTVFFFLILPTWLIPFIQSQKQIINIQKLDLTHLPELRCYFTVTDELGNYYLGLSPEDLEISIDGIIQENLNLLSALEGGEYLAIALLFDRSGSMKSAFDLTKNAAIDFVRRMSINDQIAIISFDDLVRVDSPFTKDSVLIENSITGISMGNNTALYDAIFEASNLLKNVGTNRKAVVVFSDGLDTRSQHKREDVFSEIQKAGVPLFFIGMGAKVDEDNLRGLSEGTGGHFFKAATPEEILLLYQKIAAQLQNQYVLTFLSSFGEDKDWHTLNLKFRNPKGAEFSTDKKYQATKGPGISANLVATFERESKTETFLIYLGIGAFAGLLFGLIVIIVIKLTRPEIRLLSLLIIGVILCTMLLGGILGVLTRILTTRGM